MKLDDWKNLGTMCVDKESNNWKLVRKHDGLVKYSEEVTWVEWDSDDRFKSHHNKSEIGFSLLMSPFNSFFTW